MQTLHLYLMCDSTAPMSALCWPGTPCICQCARLSVNAKPIIAATMIEAPVYISRMPCSRQLDPGIN